MIKVYCPFCKKEHDVEIRGILCVQLVDGTEISVYKCPIINKEFRIRK